MTRRFPKARPTSGVRKPPRPKRWPVHRCIPSGDEDWAGEVICQCGMKETHRVHEVDEDLAAQASFVDARRIGEGGAVDAH